MRQAGSNNWFPIFVDLKDRLCTVVGGGTVAARRVRALLETGAKVCVIAPRISSKIKRLAPNARLLLREREFRRGDLGDSILVFAATDSEEVNTMVCRAAREAGILLNSADTPGQCDFIMSSNIRRDPITVAVSTGGASPALARHLRQQIENVIEPEYRKMACLMGRLRKEAAALPSAQERRRKWQEIIDGPVRSLLSDGKEAEAEALARKQLGLGTKSIPKEDNSVVVIGTRGSRLALAQARWVAARLQKRGIKSSLKTIRTGGDKSGKINLLAEEGAFVKELETALRNKEVDLAVHSLKDLPIGRRKGLVVAAIPIREDPRDALITINGKKLKELPALSRVATSSPRRTAQIKSLRPDLTIVPVRGNVDTRIDKLNTGEFEALVVALAGLARLGIATLATEVFSAANFLPAPGQGALALQVRTEDKKMRAIAGRLNHLPTEQAVKAERTFLAQLGGGCGAAAAALGKVQKGRLRLQVAVKDPHSNQLIRGHVEGAAAESTLLGRELAKTMQRELAGLKRRTRKTSTKR